MARPGNTSENVTSLDLEVEHRLLFEMNQYADGKTWALVKSTVSIDKGESIPFQPGEGRVSGIMVLAAAFLVLESRSIPSVLPVIDARASRWERILAKKVYQHLQDAQDSKGNKPHYLHRAFGTITIDEQKRPGVMKLMRAIGGKIVRYHEDVNPPKLRVECLVNGAPITDSQIAALLEFLCKTSPVLFTPTANETMESTLIAPGRGAQISGPWNCTSTFLVRVKKLPRTVSWVLNIKIDEKNVIEGTCSYRSPVEGSNHRQIPGTIKGDFIPEGGYLRLEWWVSARDALGFGFHVLRVHSNRQSMEGYGIGHSSEGDGMFVVRIKCTKAPEGRAKAEMRRRRMRPS